MIKLYSQHGCGMCLTIKRVLDNKHIEYEHIEIPLDERQKYAEQGIEKTPTLQVDEKLYTGRDIIDWINKQ